MNSFDGFENITNKRENINNMGAGDDVIKKHVFV